MRLSLLPVASCLLLMLIACSESVSTESETIDTQENQLQYYDSLVSLIQDQMHDFAMLSEQALEERITLDCQHLSGQLTARHLGFGKKLISLSQPGESHSNLHEAYYFDGELILLAQERFENKATGAVYIHPSGEELPVFENQNSSTYYYVHKDTVIRSSVKKKLSKSDRPDHVNTLVETGLSPFSADSLIEMTDNWNLYLYGKSACDDLWVSNIAAPSIRP